MANLDRNREEFVGSQHEDHFVNLERRKYRKNNLTPSVRVETQCTEHTERSYFRMGSHILHEQEMWNLRLEIDRLHKKLRRRERSRRNFTPHHAKGLRRTKIDLIGKDPELLPTNLSSCPCSQMNLKSVGGTAAKGSKKNIHSQNMGNDAMSKALR